MGLFGRIADTFGKTSASPQLKLYPSWNIHCFPTTYGIKSGSRDRIVTRMGGMFAAAGIKIPISR